MGIGTKTMGICMGTSELERRKAGAKKEPKKGNQGEKEGMLLRLSGVVFWEMRGFWAKMRGF